MLTRCPACKTTFRVTTAQLKVRMGQVRCGTCQEVFNALDALVDALPDLNTVARLPASEPATAQEQSATERSFHSLLSKEDLPEFSPSARDFESPRDDLEDSTEAFESLVADELNEDKAISPLPPTRRRRWPWAVASGIASTVLLAQLVVHYRVEIAVLAPDARPSLEAICELATCSVDLPSKAELLSIEASDLHPRDPAVPTQLELTATLRNRAPFAQSWPHLELTLTDTADSAVARRVVSPKDYLPKGRELASGFSSQSDSAVSVHLATDGLPASGYRLYLFYP